MPTCIHAHVRLSFPRLSERLTSLDATKGCAHIHAELRYITDSLGRKLWVQQCLDCGARTHKGWLPTPPRAVAEAAKPLDTDAEGAFLRRQSVENRKIYQTKRQAEHIEYEKYINTSPDWKDRRDLVMKRAGGICEACLWAAAVHAHHVSYSFLYDEILWELRAVCRNCHMKIHGREFTP